MMNRAGRKAAAMSSFALVDARRKREEAHAAIKAHDRGCGECDVRRRRRCEQGMTLVRAYWALEQAVGDELARQREPNAGQDLLDFGYLSVPAEVQAAREGREKEDGDE
jgi:hypothetical protein